MKPYFKVITTLFLISVVKVSFAQTPSFGNYKTKIFIGRAAKLKIKGNALAERYKTAISNSYNDDPYIRKFHGKGGLNFAGHYCFAYWGCGSDCQQSAIVDLQTGKVYDGPTAARQFEYRRWSRLLIVNRPGDKSDCAVCQPEYWILNEQTKHFVKIK
ncbi:MULTISPECIES: hypothetical protein [Mucilaginibacter]|jgi:hypothetical protein|uniref:Uncharacterized protein n=1 Tax=Mucilaginibacter rubeus TaxID=2027860 RepID=A0AAE6MGN8_9SPHI|nr:MULTISPECIES: hypothetical protein [Mucilaginibacter]NVM67101.1 hypothetical protein [Mucilaginibacter sp. SG538B]QEM02389.1 hypothetical protein DIU31_002210 [Mucilaginibacter rubeus]QEM15014.1 hypothetical protein DIU38_002235 [Mucilaginibacter gossypii]QTE42270.1 hypothetical protein J3L19_25565 [Mucilaginibacter rubeus]QTE48871.1 hypothetical protein J3L21_25535 [Mucilaginibacter rubeus]